ncbi:MAG: hypothetical protein IH865_10015 [Chloroflexi bacterium]|nr:hypothetical protein [Chloroflexota bacterium]
MADLDFIQTSMQQMAALFEGLSREETKQLLAALERSGAAVYNSLAEEEQDADAKAALLSAAGREIENAEVLELLAANSEQ